MENWVVWVLNLHPSHSLLLFSFLWQSNSPIYGPTFMAKPTNPGFLFWPHINQKYYLAIKSLWSCWPTGLISSIWPSPYDPSHGLCALSRYSLPLSRNHSLASTTLSLHFSLVPLAPFCSPYIHSPNFVPFWPIRAKDEFLSRRLRQKCIGAYPSMSQCPNVPATSLSFIHPLFCHHSPMPWPFSPHMTWYETPNLWPNVSVALSVWMFSRSS